MGLFDDLTGTAGEGSRKKEKRTGKARTGVSPNNMGKGGKGKKSPVDIVTAAGVPTADLPSNVEDVARLLPGWVSAWCERNAVTDIRKTSPLVFNALCAYVGTIVKASGIIKDTRQGAAGACVGSTCNRYDPAAVLALYDVFAVFCATCDKIPFQNTFAAFCGVSIAYVREYVKGLTASGFDLAKRTHDAEMQAIRQKTSGDPVGRIAILNNEYYGGGIRSEDAPQVVVDSVPTVASFALLPEHKIE